MRVVVISPHLDDAVLSIGQTIDGLAQGGHTVEVFTVFTERPRPPVQAGWDTLCGFDDSDHAFDVRHAEDAAALRTVGAAPMTGDGLLDEQYDFAAIETVEESARKLILDLVRDHPDVDLWLAPIGIGHRDHRIVGTATRTVMIQFQGLDWAIFGDLPYATEQPEELSQALAEAATMIGQLNPRPLPVGRAIKKELGINAYRSQVDHIRKESCMVDELLWSPA